MFECENEEVVPSNNCGDFGDCLSAGTCLLTEAIRRDEQAMSDYIDWERDSYNRELEEEVLGRPLFPNEY